MALSIFDQTYLSDAEKATITGFHSAWGTASETDRTQMNQIANKIRGDYGYTGGIDGTGSTEVIKAPHLDPYTSPYKSYMDNSLSQLQNYKAFDYKADKDPSYQAFVAKATRLGETAFNDNLAGMSAGTGGMENSWAASVASQSRNAYMTQAAEAMPQFEQNAYDRWESGRNAIVNQLNMYQGMDNSAYNRALDSYNSEVTAYKGALDQRSIAIAEANDRTKLLGYVNNEDAKLLGVAPGTPSFEVQKRTADMEDWIKQQTFEADQLAKELKLRASYSTRSSGGGSSSGGSGGGSGGATPDPSKADAQRNTIINDFNKTFQSDAYLKVTTVDPVTKAKVISDRPHKQRVIDMENYLDRLGAKVEAGAISMDDYEAVSEYITNSKEFADVARYM